MQKLSHMLRQAVLLPSFSDSKSYWERRYRLGGDSGNGSTGRLAAFKAKIINEFVRDQGINSVLEFGCGDGQQLALAKYPRYLGLDVSMSAIERCRERFAGDADKAFSCYGPSTMCIGAFLQADLTLSLDVIYHLVEDQTYERYLADLFSSSRRFVIVYSSDKEEPQSLPHLRHRKFTADLGRQSSDFRLLECIENPYADESFCSFFVFERTNPAADR